MKVLAAKVWREQSAALGAAATVALAVLAVVNGTPLTVDELAKIAAPFLVGVGARGRP